MNTATPTRLTVQALALYGKDPTHFLGVHTNTQGVQLLRAEPSIQLLDSTIAFTGKSRFNLRAVVAFLHAGNGFFATLSDRVVRNEEWRDLQKAYDLLQDKIKRFNEKGLRKSVAGLALPLLQAGEMNKRAMAVEVSDTHIARLQQTLSLAVLPTEEQIEAAALRLQLLKDTPFVTQESLCDSKDLIAAWQHAQLLRKRANEPLQAIEDFEAALKLMQTHAHFINPYCFNGGGKSLEQKINGNEFFEVFRGLLSYIHGKYKEYGEENIGKPPFQEKITIQELRETTAAYFKKHAANDRHLRVLILFSMLQQNRSVRTASDAALRYIRSRVIDLIQEVVAAAEGEMRVQIESVLARFKKDNNVKKTLSDCFPLLSNCPKMDKLVASLRTCEEWLQTNEKFVHYYRYDLMHLERAVEVYIERTKRDANHASLAELYALTRAFRVRVSLYAVTTSNGEAGPAELDVNAHECIKPISEDEALLGETLMVLYVNREEFCLPDQETPLSPRSAEELQNRLD